MTTVEAKRAAFRALHETGCFIIPNPFDMGSARWLQRQGFKALATTSHCPPADWPKPNMMASDAPKAAAAEMPSV